MQESSGRRSALEPAAHEVMKIVSFFDALTLSHAGFDALIRGAAVLAGTVAGAERQGRVSRFESSGQRPRADTEHSRSVKLQTEIGEVWLERSGPSDVNDRIVLERLAFALTLLDSHGSRSNALTTVIDAMHSIEDRIAALSRLRIQPDARIRIIATDLDSPAIGGMRTVAPTRFGMLQATLDLGNAAESDGAVGLGRWVRADRAPESWESAVIAHRLSTPRVPVVDAGTLGAMLLLLRDYDPNAPHEDVVMLQGLDRQTAEILRVLIEADSVRSAAIELGMHHSTLQARHESLTEHLGYDPRSTTGRMRYYAAEALRRVSEV